MFLSKYCFPDSVKVSHVVEVFKNVRKWSIVRNYCSVRLVAINSKKSLKERFIDQLEKCGMF